MFAGSCPREELRDGFQCVKLEELEDRRGRVGSEGLMCGEKLQGSP